MLFAGMNVWLFQTQGVKIGYDSLRYLEYSQEIRAASSLIIKPHYVWYIGYVLFITLVKSLYDSNTFLVLVQVLLHGIAAIVLYKSSVRLFNDRRAALLGAVLFVAWPDIPAWNFFVMTESFCISFSCVVIYALVTCSGRGWSLFVLICCVMLLFFIRPNGVAALAGMLAYLIRMYHHRLPRFSLSGALAITVIIAGMYLLLNTMLDTFVLIENYLTGEIVYNASTLPAHFPTKAQLLVRVNKNIWIPSTDWKPIPRLLLFVMYNPLFFFKIASLKLFYFLTHTKPYYSLIHNVFLLLTLLPVYFFAGKVFVKKLLPVPVKRFLIVFISIHLMIILLTVEDWDGRFLMPLLPFLFLLAGKVISDNVQKWRRSSSSWKCSSTAFRYFLSQRIR